MNEREHTVTRRPIHRRTITIEGFTRSDGLWELEATLVDVKTVDYPISSGLRPAGTPVHEMTVRIAFDHTFTIREAHAESRWVPFTGVCEAVTPRYEALVGLNLLRGFRLAVNDRFRGVQGCTHITELLYSLPTAALQTVATFRRDNEESDEKPFHLDQCHALDTESSPVVAQYYPKWFRGKAV
ncbi:DUF2889 domain-containing protein [Hydrogenophilus islandicus]